MRHALLIWGCWLLCASADLFGQGRGAEDFRLTKINRDLISTPEFSYSGARTSDTDRDARWLEVEAEFSAEPDFTDELTFRYFVLINGRLLSGEVTQVNIPAGRDRRWGDRSEKPGESDQADHTEQHRVGISA